MPLHQHTILEHALSVCVDTAVEAFVVLLLQHQMGMVSPSLQYARQGAHDAVHSSEKNSELIHLECWPNGAMVSVWRQRQLLSEMMSCIYLTLESHVVKSVSIVGV